jgi:hypothetical protein
LVYTDHHFWNRQGNTSFDRRKKAERLWLSRFNIDLPQTRTYNTTIVTSNWQLQRFSNDHGVNTGHNTVTKLTWKVNKSKTQKNLAATHHFDISA